MAGTYKRTQEHRKKMSKALKGRKITWKGKISKALKGRKLSEEHKEKLSIFREGKPSPMKGKHHSEATKRKISERGRGRIGGMLGKHHSKEVKIKMGKARIKYTGKNSPGWKGGKVRVNLLVRALKKYKNWICKILQRDNYTCRKCNNKGGRLEIHHKKPLNIIIKEYKIKTYKDMVNCNEIWDLNNGITLCKKCHRKFHKTYGIISSTKEQLKEFLII